MGSRDWWVFVFGRLRLQLAPNETPFSWKESCSPQSISCSEDFWKKDLGKEVCQVQTVPGKPSKQARMYGWIYGRQRGARSGQSTKCLQGGQWDLIPWINLTGLAQERSSIAIAGPPPEPQAPHSTAQHRGRFYCGTLQVDMELACSFIAYWWFIYFHSFIHSFVQHFHSWHKQRKTLLRQDCMLQPFSSHAEPTLHRNASHRWGVFHWILQALCNLTPTS